MTSKTPTFSMVMPCYNEQETLPETIPPLLDVFERSGIDFELAPILFALSALRRRRGTRRTREATP